MGGRKLIDKTGKRYGKLVVQKLFDKKKGRYRWLCKCDCNDLKASEVVVWNSNLYDSGGSKSCGCEILKSVTKHGESKTVEYCTWKNMVARCTKPHFKEYKNYGARGITVTKRWMKYENFLADMGRRPDGKLTLERKNNSKGYGKRNCIWATYKVQGSNKRSNKIIKFRGESLTTTQWAERIGIASQAMDYRLANWSLERALTEPRYTKLKNYKGD